MTELQPFRRLVAFVSDVEAHADVSGDDALRALVDDVRQDLIDMSGPAADAADAPGVEL